MGKKLIINCSSCDTRKVQEETLAIYDSITINAAVVLTSTESRALLGKHNVTMNCANVLDVDGDVQISTINGRSQIRSTDAPAGRQYLVVNGAVDIGPGTEKVLESYAGFLINGAVTLPESLSAYLNRMTVNGATCCYPDGAVVLKNNTFIDRTFALRAKNCLYWARKRLLMVDPKLDPAALSHKGATFSAQEVIVTESKVEALAELIDEKADIIIIPDDTAVILDDVTLTPGILRKHGTKLYLIGDLTLDADSREALESLERLTVRGDVTVPADLHDLLLEKADSITGDVKIVTRRAGRLISDKPSCRISPFLLEQEPDGIRVEDCATVKIDPDVSRELILQRLTISDCGIVVCSEEQEDAVSSICEDVGKLLTGEAGGIGDALRSVLGGSENGDQKKVVNCSSYVM